MGLPASTRSKDRFLSFKLVKAGGFGGVFKSNVDRFLAIAASLDNIGLLLDPPHLVDVFLVLASNSGFLELDNQRAYTRDFTDAANTSKCLFRSRHWGLALERSTQT